MSLAALETLLLGRLAPEARVWLEKALLRAREEGITSESFGVAWSGAGRRLGRVVLDVSDEEAAQVRSGKAVFVPAGWGADELGRALLLLAAAAGRPAAEVANIVDELFRKGEMREQQAVLRVLAYLPPSPDYVVLASEAVRSNVISVLEALACDNPFPAQHMAEPAFNQMVMKALFNGLPLARVHGLADRNNSELRRIVTDFSSERRAAGRPVPDDVQLILSSSGG